VEAICHFPNLHLVVLSFLECANLVSIKRGWEGGDLRGSDVNSVWIPMKYFQFTSCCVLDFVVQKSEVLVLS
jgi:hypothetical protein